MKHGKYYTCKRPRMLNYLLNKGFQYESVGYDWFKPQYHVWVFKNSEALEEAITEYFNSLGGKNNG